MSINWSEHMPRITAEVESTNDIEELRDWSRKLIEIINSAERLASLNEEKENKLKQLVLALQGVGNKTVKVTEQLITALQESGINTEEVIPSLHETLSNSKASLSIKFPF